MKEFKTYLKEGWYEECENVGYHDFMWHDRPVTHWQPLPKAPKI